MDRSITVPTFRPLGLSDRYIDLAVPQHSVAGGGHPFDPSMQDTSFARRQQWLNHVRIRQMESEIYAVNFGNEDYSSRSYSSWMTEMDDRLRSWKEAIITFSDSGPDWFDFVMSTVQVYLHMPCPRNPIPTDASKLICFDAVTTTLYGYLGMMRGGFLKFDWHCAYQCYPSALLVLDNAPLFARVHSNARVTNLLDNFSEAFVSKCPSAQELEPTY